MRINEQWSRGTSAVEELERLQTELTTLRTALKAQVQEWEREAQQIASTVDDPRLLLSQSSGARGVAKGLRQAAADINKLLEGK